MGCGDFAISAVTEMNCCHGCGYFQHLASAPFRDDKVTYDIPSFDCHCFIPSCVN